VKLNLYQLRKKNETIARGSNQEEVFQNYRTPIPGTSKAMSNLASKESTKKKKNR